MASSRPAVKASWPALRGPRPPTGADPQGAQFVRRLRSLTGDAVRALVQWAEAAARPPTSVVRTELRHSRGGMSVHVPVSCLWCGQTQLSFDHVATKMARFARALLGCPQSLSSLLRPYDFPVVVGPGGRFCVLRDGHHKVAALMALSALVHRARPANGDPREPLLRLAQSLPRPEQLDIPAWVEAQGAAVPFGVFWETLRDPERFAPPLFLNVRGSAPASNEPPRSFAELVDNPYRKLAADLVGKFEVRGDRLLTRNAARPLWLKGPRAPDYIEFHVAEVLERICDEHGYAYTPGRSIPPDLRRSFATGLRRARNDEPRFADIIVPDDDILLADVEDAFDWGGRTCFDPRRPDDWSRREVPTWIAAPVRDGQVQIKVGFVVRSLISRVPELTTRKLRTRAVVQEVLAGVGELSSREAQVAHLNRESRTVGGLSAAALRRPRHRLNLL